MFENPINKLRFWCHKVIPLVYDEALSYYEVLCKVAKKINELITDVNGLHDTVVFQVNGKEPTDGNVQLDGGDFSGDFVSSINGITPEEDGSITIDAEDIGALPDNYTPPVTSVNNKTGAVALNASDVGALPNSIDPVESVNGISPDAQGNVNVGTVKSVNNTMPDASGNVNLTASDVGAVSAQGPTTKGTPVTAGTNVVIDWQQVVVYNHLAFIRVQLHTTDEIKDNDVLATFTSTDIRPLFDQWIIASVNNGTIRKYSLNSTNNNITLGWSTTLPSGTYVDLMGVYATA